MSVFSAITTSLDQASNTLSTAVNLTGEKPVKLIIIILVAGAFVLLIKLRTVTYEYAKIYPF
jgi:hypothetical protein